MLLYGCSLWCSAALAKRNRSLLRSVQRLLCLMSLRALSTAPSLALFLLTAQIPVDYRILELSVSCQTRIPPGSLAPSTSKAIHHITCLLPPVSTEIPTAAFIPNHPPWHQKELPSVILSPGTIGDPGSQFPSVENALRCFV